MVTFRPAIGKIHEPLAMQVPPGQYLQGVSLNQPISGKLIDLIIKNEWFKFPVPTEEG